MRFIVFIMGLFLALNLNAQTTKVLPTTTSDTAVPKNISTIDLVEHINETKAQSLEEFYKIQFESVGKKKGAVHQVTVDGKTLYFENRPVFLLSTLKKDSSGVSERYVVAKRDDTVPYEKYKWKSVPMKELKLLMQGN